MKINIGNIVNVYPIYNYSISAIRFVIAHKYIAYAMYNR